MNWLLNLAFGRRISRETESYLAQLSAAPVKAARHRTTDLLASFEKCRERKVTLGKTAWGAEVTVPLLELVRAHGLATGGTGSGKTMWALLIVQALIE
jgi:hypothetical protein